YPVTGRRKPYNSVNPHPMASRGGTMSNKTLEEASRFRLKEPTGWFAAGNRFQRALTGLSDGAFKLFAYLCMEANRQTGRLEATHQELAMAFGKSKRTIGTYVEELQTQHVCLVLPAKNQYARTVFEIADDYWPYYRGDLSPDRIRSTGVYRRRS